MLITVPSLRPEEKDAAGNLVRVADADAIRKSLEDLEEQIGNLSTFTVTQVEANPTANQMQDVLKTIEKRVNPYGIAEPVIQLMDNNRVLVQLPGLHDVEEVKRLIGRTARLEFKERECLANTAIATSNGSFYPCELPENHIDKETGLTGEDLERTFPGTEPTTGQPIVNVQFNSHGTKIFAELTRRLFQTLNPPTQDRFVVIMDNDEIIAPVVNQPILSGSAFIEGPDFTPSILNGVFATVHSLRVLWGIFAIMFLCCIWGSCGIVSIDCMGAQAIPNEDKFEIHSSDVRITNALSKIGISSEYRFTLDALVPYL